jgi:hypothetical protein
MTPGSTGARRRSISFLLASAVLEVRTTWGFSTYAGAHQESAFTPHGTEISSLDAIRRDYDNFQMALANGWLCSKAELAIIEDS